MMLAFRRSQGRGSVNAPRHARQGSLPTTRPRPQSGPLRHTPTSTETFCSTRIRLGAPPHKPTCPPSATRTCCTRARAAPSTSVARADFASYRPPGHARRPCVRNVVRTHPWIPLCGMPETPETPTARARSPRVQLPPCLLPHRVRPPFLPQPPPRLRMWRSERAAQLGRRRGLPAALPTPAKAHPSSSQTTSPA